MNYIDLTNNTSGTTNYEQLSNQPQINNVILSGNKSLSDLGINQPLPDGYEITVDAGGNGDFTDIQSAINSLTGKYSAGTVTISINSGTYNLNSSTLMINTSKWNIPYLLIKGTGTTTTIINRETLSAYNAIVQVANKCGIVELKDLSITTPTKPNFDIYCINADNSNLRINNVKTSNGTVGFYARYGGEITAYTKLECVNCTYGVFMDNARMATSYRPTFTFNNVSTALHVNAGGYISLTNVKKEYTSVTNQTNTSMNTITASGIITGSIS